MVAALAYRDGSQRKLELKFAQTELAHLQNLRQTLEHQRELKKLEEVVGFEDQVLLRRLHDAGFDSRNIHALPWLPIALVAWASHGVSPDEAQAAKLVNLYSLLAGNAQSSQLFQAWLQEKPHEKLIKLWEDFVRKQSTISDENWRERTGEAILYVATKVAEASGGFFGLGQISAAEQRVLDRIRSIYGLTLKVLSGL